MKYAADSSVPMTLIHQNEIGILLSPCFSLWSHWKKNLNDRQIAYFQCELADLGYKFQFVTLAGFHSLNLGMFELAQDYARSGMSARLDAR